MRDPSQSLALSEPTSRARCAPAGALSLRDEARGLEALLRFGCGGYENSICLGRDSLWLLARQGGQGGFALRLACAPGGGLSVRAATQSGASATVTLDSPIGDFRVEVASRDVQGDVLLRARTTLTPHEDVFIPYAPRDLYPLDGKDDPLQTEGRVEAAQRGLNTGLVFFHCTAPFEATALYLQDLTELNPYFEATGSKPDGAVGGAWPELGYQLPAAQGAPSAPRFLARGRDVVISSVKFQVRTGAPQDERQSAAAFLDLLAHAYTDCIKPETYYRDWPARAEQSLRHLRTSTKVTQKHYGKLFVRPYTDAEEPDSMVQLTVTTPLLEYCGWRRRIAPVAEELRAGVGKFFDPKLAALRRYLPNTKKPNADEMDSWYLYHPLTNLGRLALSGDEEAKQLFIGSMDYAVRVARKFDYVWPIKFDVTTLEVLQRARKEGAPGQSDVGGIYAYVMLQAYELTGEARYQQEAERAVQAMTALKFETEYQANLSAWGAAACLRLWKQTEISFYRDQALLLIACLFHNCIMWKSELEGAKHYDTFLGMSCLHDAPYMAIYECWESFAAFHECIHIAGSDLPPSARMLMTEYCKHALDRAWFYYPAELPEACLSPEVKNGHIDCKLAFPLEDLYPGGDPAGQVGQEIYGAGAAFAFVTHAYARTPGDKFLLWCDHPFSISEASDGLCLTLLGATDGVANLRLLPAKHPLGEFFVSDGASELVGQRKENGQIAYAAPADAVVQIRSHE